jgi:hypothetical protein
MKKLISYLKKCYVNNLKFGLRVFFTIYFLDFTINTFLRLIKSKEGEVIITLEDFIVPLFFALIITIIGVIITYNKRKSEQ